jgi:hypothetical protein
MVKDDNSPELIKNCMNYFYIPEYETNENVINAWYIYVLKILPLVSKKWRDAVTPNRLSKSTSMFLHISISDEALMRWFLTLWVVKHSKTEEDKTGKGQLFEEISEEKSFSNDSKIETACSNKGERIIKKRGPHDSNVKLNIYTTLFHEITRARQDYKTAVRWNLIFWNEVKKRNASIIEKTGENSKNAILYDNATDLPLPDFNENQEFLASYNIMDSNGDLMDSDKHEDDDFPGTHVSI